MLCPHNTRLMSDLLKFRPVFAWLLISNKHRSRGNLNLFAFRYSYRFRLKTYRALLPQIEGHSQNLLGQRFRKYYMEFWTSILRIPDICEIGSNINICCPRFADIARLEAGNDYISCFFFADCCLLSSG